MRASTGSAGTFRNRCTGDDEMARIQCVYDEGAVVGTPLIGAKGFSVLVESDGKRVLFDTGLRDRYLQHNMEHLEIDPESIDAVVISQRRPDNGRALNGFLGMRSSPVDIYAPAGMYDGKKGMLSSSVGLSEENRPKAVFHDIEGWIEVIPKVWVTPQLVSSDGYRESFLVIEGKGLTVVSGRGHSGPGAVLEEVRSKFGKDACRFVGAVLLEKRKKPVAEAYAMEFDAHGCTDLHMNHCVGYDGISKLREHFGLKGVNEFFAGMELSV